MPPAKTKNIGPLRARIVNKPGDPDGSRSPLTVVLLHGFGAPGDDLAALADMIDAPPGTTFVFPEALHDMAELVGPMYLGARAWWMIDMARLEMAIRTGALRDLSADVPHGLDDARSAVVAMLGAFEREGIRAERLVLGGFSQGAMLALDVALRTKLALESLVLLSGTLIAEREWTPLMAARAGTPVFQSHGTADPILPSSIAERLRGLLDEAGLRVRFEQFEGGHGIPPRIMQELGAFLCDRE